MKVNDVAQQNRIIKIYNICNQIIKLEQVADVNKMIDSVTDEQFNQDERLPYWAEVWPSAQALSGYILENKNSFKNKKVLELGCGIGMVGIAATFAGADVLFSDYENEALDFVNCNFFINFKKQAKTILLDWREPNLDKTFEIILAADILYEKRFIEPVYRTVKKLLLDNGQVFIAEPDRTIARSFFELMENGFELTDKKTITTNLRDKKFVTLYRYIKC